MEGAEDPFHDNQGLTVRAVQGLVDAEQVALLREVRRELVEDWPEAGSERGRVLEEAEEGILRELTARGFTVVPRFGFSGYRVDLAVMDFAFMGGSMGSVVGEKIARLVRRSGGARMQEGVLSLMQMAKTSVVLAELARAGVPFVSILTNPTTGGVSASYAMLGDAIIAEPGAVIGFAGPRVIKQTLGQDLPEGFQTAEFLLDHGILDLVAHRRDRFVQMNRRAVTAAVDHDGPEHIPRQYRVPQRAIERVVVGT